jgi:hypothetical protein
MAVCRFFQRLQINPQTVDKLIQESRNYTFSLVYFGFSELSQNIICRPILRIPSPPVRAMSTSVEAQIIQLHLRHFMKDQITTALRTGKPQVSRCIRDFRQTGIIPEARRIGRPRKRPYSLDRSRRSPAAARLADHRAMMEAIVREMGNTKRFAIEESMIPRAAAGCAQRFIGLEGPREVSSTGPNRPQRPISGLK